MKKLLTILFLLAAGIVSAQEPIPSGLKAVNSQFYIHLPDSAIYHGKGSPYGFHRIAKYKDILDALTGVVHLTGDQTVGGNKIFTSTPRVDQANAGAGVTIIEGSNLSDVIHSDSKVLFGVSSLGAVTGAITNRKTNGLGVGSGGTADMIISTLNNTSIEVARFNSAGVFNTVGTSMNVGSGYGVVLTFPTSSGTIATLGGAETFTGSKRFNYTPALTNPTIRVGDLDGASYTSDRTGVNVSIDYDDVLSNPGHAFADRSRVRITGGSYNSVDASPTFSGASSLRDHYAGVQVVPNFIDPITFNDIYLFHANPKSSLVTGNKIFGLRVDTLRGTWNEKYALYSADPTAKISIAGELILRNAGFNVNGASAVTGALTATSFVKSGGTSSQFLKADGSVDGSTYLTSAVTSLSGTTNQISASAGTGSVTLSLPSILALPNSGTNGTWLNLNSTGGAYFVGVENSAGSNLNSPAYSLVLLAPTSRPIVMSQGGTARQTIDANGYTVLNTVPVTSAGSYQVLTRNSSTGVVEKISMGALSGSTQLEEFYVNAATSGTTETDLYSYSLPSNTLVNDGDKVVVTFNSTYTGTSPERKYYFGSAFLTEASAQSDQSTTFTFIKSGANTVRVIMVGSSYGSVDISSLTFSSPITIKMTGKVASGSMTGKGATIEFKPAAI